MELLRPCELASIQSIPGDSFMCIPWTAYFDHGLWDPYGSIRCFWPSHFKTAAFPDLSLGCIQGFSRRKPVVADSFDSTGVYDGYMGVSKMGDPKNGLFIIENPIRMDDLGIPSLQETSISTYAILQSPFITLNTETSETRILQRGCKPHCGQHFVGKQVTMVPQP